VSKPSDGTYSLVESYLQFDSTGIGNFVQVVLDMSSTQYAYPLSSFPISNGQYQLQVPYTTSGRIYFSFAQKLDLTVVVGRDLHNKAVSLTVAEPDPFDTQDVNFATIYDKIEYTYNDKGVWIDTTAVDFFALPLALTLNGELVGFTQSREAILSRLTQTFIGDWASLVVRDPLDPSGANILRVVAPNKAIGRSTDTENFNEHYLDAPIRAIWEYYQNHTIIIDCSELNGTVVSDVRAKTLDSTAAHFTGRSIHNGGAATFTFTNSANDTIAVNIPSSNDVFGASGVLNAIPHTAQSVIVRNIAAALNVGVLPLADGTMLNKAQFLLMQSQYYHNSSLLPPNLSTQPQYNLYAQALHGLSKHIYAFAYDDVLSQDSTLFTDTPSDMALVTIGDMSGTVMPNPVGDTTIYTVTFHVGAGASGTFVNPNERDKHYALTPANSPVAVQNVRSPFVISYDYGQGSQQYTITILLRSARPALPLTVTSVSDRKVVIDLPGAPR
jgi:hypothetical protein